MKERNDSRMQIHEALRSRLPLLVHARAHAIVSEATGEHLRYTNISSPLRSSK
jgi:hypothetical protein